MAFPAGSESVRLSPASPTTAHSRPGRASGRRPEHDVETWMVTDDWPDPAPITDAELDVFEGWFGDLFDELFEPSR